VERTARYYDKMKKSILNSIMPPMERSKSKMDLRSSFDQRDDFLNPSFQPEINERSRKMRRTGSVGEILYEDAR
jgi:hypothetical protein